MDIPKVLKPEEVLRLKQAIGFRGCCAKRNHAVVELMHGCGLRVSEACGLLRENFRGDVLHVSKETAKGSKSRTIPIPYETERIVKDHLAHCRDSVWVFPTNSRSGDKCVSSGYMLRTVKRFAERAGLPGWVCNHTMRHCCATELLHDTEANIVDVQAVLGHSNVAITSVYVHARPDRLMNIMRG